MNSHSEASLLYKMGKKCEEESTYDSQVLAFRFYEEAHAAGHPVAAARLGHYYLKYTKMDPSPGSAKHWFNAALAIKKIPSDVQSTVENNLAVVLLQEINISPAIGDMLTKATELLKSAQKRGAVAATYNLGCICWLEDTCSWLVSDSRYRWDVARDYWYSAAKGGHDVADQNTKWLEIAYRFGDLEDGDAAHDLAMEQIVSGLVYIPHEQVCPDVEHLWQPEW